MASRSLGTLTIDILAKTGLLEQGMDRAGRSVDKMTRETRRKMDQWAHDLDKAYAAASVAAAAAFAGIGVAVKKSIDDMVEIGVQAKQVAMPIADFSAFAVAAKNAEVDTSSFSTSLVQLARALQMAKQGSAQYTGAFKALGIDPSKINTTKQGLEAIADAFSRYRDDANKVAIAQQLLGQSGTRMIAFLDQGSGAIDTQAKRMQVLNVAWGEDAARAVAAFDDQQDELRNTLDGLTRTLAIELLPSLTSVNTTLTEFAQSSDAKDFASGLSTVLVTLGRAALVVAAAFDEIGKTIGGTFAVLQQGLQGLKATDVLLGPAGIAYRFAQNAKDVKATAHEVTADIAASTKAWMDRIANFGKEAASTANGMLTGDQVPAWMKAGLPVGENRPSIKVPRLGGVAPSKSAADPLATLTGFNSGLEGAETASLSAPLKQYVDTMTRLTSAFDDAIKKGGDMAKAQALFNDKAAEANQTLGLQEKLLESNAMADFLKQNRAAIDGVTGAEETFRDTSAMATKALNAGAISWDAYARIIERARDSMNGIDEQAKKTNDAMSQFSIQAARNMQSAFADFLFDPFKDGLKGMLGSFIDTLRRMAAEAVAAKVFNAIGDWGKQNQGDGGFTGMLASFASAFGSAAGRAGGGPVAAGGLYEVNERGMPEMLAIGGRQFLMMGPQAGVVRPASQRSAGGTTINVAVQPTSTRRTADQVATAIARQQRIATARNG